MRSRIFKRRFALILVFFTVMLAVMWFVYYTTSSRYVGRTMREAIELAESNLLTELNDEFSRLKVAATVIGSSIYVQEFLMETDVEAYLEKTSAVAEIIRKTTYPAMSGDCIYTVSASGVFYRFTGGVSSDAFEGIYADVINGATTYSVEELGGAGWFCLSNPVYPRGSAAGAPVGHIVILSNLAKARRALTKLDSMTGVDTAVIVDGVILFSSNPELDGKDAAELDRLYSSVSVERVTGSNMYAAAAITSSALYFGERLFLASFAIVFVAQLAAFALLYRVLSARMVSPMLESADGMRMDLLKTQIDAHFVVNTITCIEGLIHQDKKEKAAKAAENLAHMLKARHTPDDEINVFDQMEDVQRYIEIMNIRCDDKFRVETDVDDTLFRCRILAQVLQPLVENALTHGLGNKETDCRLDVAGRLEKDGILFIVSDNGIGIAQAQLRALQEVLDTADEWEYSEQRLEGVALVNIQKRIRAKYGAQFGLTVSGNPGRGLTVTVKLPVIME